MFTNDHIFFLAAVSIVNIELVFKVNKHIDAKII